MVRRISNQPKVGNRAVGLIVASVVAGCLAGCEVDSFFDPSKTGRFEFTPTLIPVLDRIDVIEQEPEFVTRTSPVMTEDLIPSDLVYQLYPGDVVTVSIFELYQTGLWNSSTRRVDAGGNYRVPELGDIPAAGLTPQQFEDVLSQELHERVILNPQVDVVVEQSGGLRYTIYGFVQSPGMFTLNNPDLRLLDALAIAGGVPLATQRIFVIREIPLTDQIEPSFNRNGDQDVQPDQQPATIDDLIDQLEERDNSADSSVRPGMLQDGTPPIDIDDLEPVDPVGQAQRTDDDELEPVRMQDAPPVDIDQVQLPVERDDSGDTYIYLEERGEWVRVQRDPGAQIDQPEKKQGPLRMVVERIIEIDYQRLAKGDSSFNIVVRPSDRIYVDGPTPGNVYIDGEVVRPGVYSLPSTGKLTLSRLIAASGGFSAIAIPERVDLTRVVADDLEATIRLNLAAIRQRTEPDVVLKPNDHIIVGTSWVATPLAVIRNGFRATYGFGFLLDRNFGNDVFGAPPTNRFGQ